MAEIVPNRVPCGKRPTPPPPPKPEPTPGTLCDLTGVKYFKLQSDIPGDYTKNCGLLGNEIDENFYFLRSMDIKTAYTIDEEGRKILVLERIHCNRDIKVDITDARDYKFRLEDGYLIITHPGGYEERVGKFLVEGDDVHVVTDSSIQGDGSCERPLGVDLAYRTGTYAPADFYVDFTCGDRKLEDYEDIGYSHAIVTKELASRFGALYTYGQVKAIAADLGEKDCHWRVPSVEDWGKLLNAAEPNEKSRNHNTEMTGNFGCLAGNRLKSVEFWDVEKPAEEPIDDLGLTIYPVGVCPEVYNTKDPDEYGFMGLYGVTSFWESGETNGQAYVRTFSYGHDDVAQFLESKASRRSVRLVMDVDDDFDIPEYALILDNYVEVVYVPEAKQLWTKYNIGFKNYSGYVENQVTVPVEWAEVEDSGNTMNLITETKYYYNAWDGRAWHKKMMKEGESVVLLYEDPEEPCDTASTAYVTSANTNHEWRVFFNEETQLDELIDTLEALKKEFQKEFDKINDAICGLTEDMESLSGTVADMYDEMQSGFTSAFTAIDDLQRQLDEEVSARTEADDYLQEQIDELDEMLSAETMERIAADEELWEALSGETEERIAVDEDLQNQIDEEVSARTAADEYLQEQIDELNAKTIEPLDESIVVEVSGSVTSIGVVIDSEDEHLKLGENGLWIDGDYGEFQD